MTVREDNFDKKVVPAADKVIRYMDAPVGAVPGKTWDALVPIPGGTTKRPAGTILGWIDVNVNRGFAEQKAILGGLVGALAAVNKGEPFDEAKLLASIEAKAAAGAERGLLNAIESITKTETTNVSLKENGPTA